MRVKHSGRSEIGVSGPASAGGAGAERGRRALKAATLDTLQVQPRQIRIVAGTFRLGTGRIEIRPAALFADLPPTFLRPRTVGLMKRVPRLLEFMSLAHPLVLIASDTRRAFTLVCGVETWAAALALGPLDMPVTVHSYVVREPRR